MLLRMLQRRVNRSHLSSSISQRWMGLFLHCSEYYGLVYVARGCLSSTYASMALEWPYVVVKPRLVAEHAIPYVACVLPAAVAKIETSLLLSISTVDLI